MDKLFVVIGSSGSGREYITFSVSSALHIGILPIHTTRVPKNNCLPYILNTREEILQLPKSENREYVIDGHSELYATSSCDMISGFSYIVSGPIELYENLKLLIAEREIVPIILKVSKSERVTRMCGCGVQTNAPYEDDDIDFSEIDKSCVVQADYGFHDIVATISEKIKCIMREDDE